ncbi:MAG: hypothetical protein JXA25_02925 [Anaerolineales bacterium]|nr:hypothetical protein [Anaerolineales bacterium]
MTDPLGKISEGQGVVAKIRNFLSGFIGYVEAGNRRTADKMLRETISMRFEEQWSRMSELQREFISSGNLELVDDLEAAAIKIRTFADRIKTASYGYSGFFDAVNINKDEIQKLYEFDLSMLEKSEQVGRAVDNVEQSIGTDGLPASIRNLVSLSQEVIDIYNRREEVILSI